MLDSILREEKQNPVGEEEEIERERGNNNKLRKNTIIRIQPSLSLPSLIENNSKSSNPRKRQLQKSRESYHHNLDLLSEYILSRIRNDNKEPLTKEKIKELAQQCINKFTTLKRTFLQSNPHFLRELNIKVMESKGSKDNAEREQKRKEEARGKEELELRKIKKYDAELSRLLITYKSLQNQILAQDMKIIDMNENRLVIIRKLQNERQKLYDATKKLEKKKKIII